jgi:3-deoxy-D-manno-octulosonic acid (KDO) 8-phosphate synthase
MLLNSMMRLLGLQAVLPIGTSLKPLSFLSKKCNKINTAIHECQGMSKVADVCDIFNIIDK